VKRRDTADKYCAACGILLTDDDKGGICCLACLREYPELNYMDRDEVIVWLYERWRSIPGVPDKSVPTAAARAWLRMQVRRGRDDDGIAKVAAEVYGISKTTAPKLKKYVQKLREQRQMAMMTT